MVCSMTRLKVKVKVMSPSKLEIRPFQNISPLPFTKGAERRLPCKNTSSAMSKDFYW